MGTGQLEGHVYGQTAHDVINNCHVSIFPENEERDKDSVLHKRSLTGVTINIPEKGKFGGKIFILFFIIFYYLYCFLFFIFYYFLFLFCFSFLYYSFFYIYNYNFIISSIFL